MSDVPLNVIPPRGGDRAEPGMDHPWFPFSGITSRPRPRGNPSALSLSVVVDLTAVEWEAPGHEPIVRPPGGRGAAPFPDYPRMSHREYGHRTGIFRLLDHLDEVDVPIAVVIDVLTARHYPSLLEHLRPRTAEFLAGGMSASRPITSAMGEDEERDYVGTTLDELQRALGARPAGWAGPQQSQSARTPGILAELGVTYTTDWGNDEQPYAFRGEAEGLWSFPVSWELSDLSAMTRDVADVTYAESIIEAATTMEADGTDQPRVLGLLLHPWISGQPYLTPLVRDALRRVVASDSVRAAAPAEVLAAFRQDAG